MVDDSYLVLYVPTSQLRPNNAHRAIRHRGLSSAAGTAYELSVCLVCANHFLLLAHDQNLAHIYNAILHLVRFMLPAKLINCIFNYVGASHCRISSSESHWNLEIHYSHPCLAAFPRRAI